MPILFEVYKWLLQKSTLTIAHNALDILLEEFVVISVNQKELLELQAFIHRLPTWKGSLEDATVIAIAFRYRKFGFKTPCFEHRLCVKMAMVEKPPLCLNTSEKKIRLKLLS